jgi:hypothetical protein
MGLILERDVSNDTISAYLMTQGVSHTVDKEGDIYVTDKNLGFPFWIRVERPFKVLMFNTYIGLGSAKRAEAALEKVQRFGYGLLTPHFCLDDCDLHANFNMSFREGVIDAHIFDTACRFSECFLRAKNAVGGKRAGFRTVH